MYYETLPQLMSLYQKLIHCWSVIFDKRNQITPLDNMNFNRSVFPNPLDISSISSVIPYEPGYFSPDASSELDRIVRFYEINRLNYLDPRRKENSRKLVSEVGVGFGNGTSNVVFNVLRSLIENKKTSSANINVVIALPNYPVYYSQLLSMNVEIRVVKCKEENHFLPTFDDIISLCDKDTAGVLITFPNNPAQHSLTDNFPIESLLTELIKLDATLVIDNIYRETQWDGCKNSLEVMLRVNDSRNWILVYGPSKDTPFLSGYRLGYWIGDPKIREKYRELVSATENCLNSYSILLFAFFLLFKGVLLRRDNLTENDLEMLNDGCCGWSVRIDTKEMFEKVQSNKWLERYRELSDESNILQKTALKKVMNYLNSSTVFSSPINGNIGNLILTGVNRSYFQGSSFDLFEWCLDKPKVGILPGSVFGIETIKNDFVSFRMTTIHDTPENIIYGLERLENSIKKLRNRF